MNDEEIRQKKQLSPRLNQTLFISDLHLSEKYTHLNNLFDKLLQNLISNAQNIDALYILGDFFNVWLGDDIAEQWEKGIAAKLARIVDSGIPVYFMHGNRDFLLGKSFLHSAKCILLEDPTVISIYGKKIILKHGDDLCTEDVKYQIFRRFVRMSWVKKIYVSLPSFCRKRIATSIRKTSQDRGMRDIYAKVSLKLVNDLLQKEKADWLIHGHTHCPQMKEIIVNKKACKHVILSDWNTQGNWLSVSSDGAALLEYFS